MQPLSRSDIAARIPHKDTMSLIDAVTAWDAQYITCEAHYPDPTTHPLSISGTLSLFCLAEYGAQAMAIHGSLTSDTIQKEGYLVALKHVIPFVEELPVGSNDDSLCIKAETITREPEVSLYAFTVSYAGDNLLKGQAMVMVKEVGN